MYFAAWSARVWSYLVNHPGYLFTLSGGCLFFITFPKLWLLVFPGLVLFLVAVIHVERSRTAFLGGWLTGSLKLAGGLFWGWAAYPLVWINISSPALELFFFVSFWVLSAAAGGLGIALTGWGLFYLYKYKSVLAILLAFPFVWSLAEILGSLVLSVALLGPGSYVHPYSTYGHTGLALANVEWLLFLAKGAGIYGLTFSVVALSSILYLTWLKPKLGPLSLGALLVVLISLHLFIELPQNPSAWQGRVIAVDTYFTAASQQTAAGFQLKEMQIKEAVTGALKREPDLIILPEDSRFTRTLIDTKENLAYLQSVSPTSSATIVDSARIPLTENSVALRAFIYQLNEKSVNVIDKQYLVPQGEYLPYLYQWTLTVGAEELLETVSRNQNYVPGPYEQYSHPDVNVPGILFCYSSADGLGVKHSSEHNFPIVAHPVSHSWFDDPSLMWHQLDLMLKVQAIWNQKIIISAGNMSPSKIYYPDGKVESGQVVEQGSFWKLMEYKFEK